jgi:hypothetical protein
MNKQIKKKETLIIIFYLCIHITEIMSYKEELKIIEQDIYHHPESNYQFLYRGITCIIKRSYDSHWCGYAIFPFALENDENINVHGGITFHLFDENHSIFGFHCAHVYDLTQKDARFYEEHGDIFWKFMKKYRNFEYVVENTKLMVDDIIENKI